MSRQLKILLWIVMTVAMTCGFLHHLVDPNIMNFERLHIFLFNLCAGGTLLIYFTWSWSHGRQTLPMKTWRFRLVTHNGQPLHPQQALLRYLVCWPSVFFCGIGIAWALIDRDRQFLHDRLAGTRLISER